MRRPTKNRVERPREDPAAAADARSFRPRFGRPDAMTSRLERNLDGIRQRIGEAAARAGRTADDVCLVAVTKTVPAAVVRDLAGLGQRDFGENRLQIAEPKIAELTEAFADLDPPPRWHWIGNLQRNKVGRTLPLFSLMHSIDSTKLAGAIDRAAGAREKAVEGLLQVNTSGEETKGGFSPAELLESYGQCRTLANLRVRGLMTMAPYTDDAESIRPFFRRLRELRDELRDRYPDDTPLGLSMGMSGDYEVAIEEGADWIRVGSALYEGIETPAS